MIEITVKYYKEANLAPFIIKPTIEEYFDEPEESDLDIDSVSRCLDPRDYLSDTDNVVKIDISLLNKSTDKKLVLEFNYFDAGESSISYRTEYEHDRVTYKEQIIDMLIPPSTSDCRKMHNMARFTLENGRYNCIYRAIIADNEDGTEREFKF